MVDGEVTRVKKVVKKPVEEYLREQKRFRHLFKPTLQTEEIAKIQAIADRNFERFGTEIRLPAEEARRRRLTFFSFPRRRPASA